jgi:hypothetical protein
MANCAQLINCLNRLYLAHEDKFVITPVGHVFEPYASHQGAQALRMVCYRDFATSELRASKLALASPHGSPTRSKAQSSAPLAAPEVPRRCTDYRASHANWTSR